MALYWTTAKVNQSDFIAADFTRKPQLDADGRREGHTARWRDGVTALSPQPAGSQSKAKCCS